jgi:hypothetical protein
MVKFNKQDYAKWENFRMGTKSHLEPGEFELVCKLHAEYHNGGHNYYKPCTCNPKTIKQWIKDLNVIWNNGIK